MQNFQQQDVNKFIKIDSVSNLTSLGKSTILLWESQGRFPQAVRLSKTKRVWLESDVDEWILKMHETNQSNAGGHND